MAHGEEIRRVLVETGVLPPQMPNNYTFEKVREIISQLEKYDLQQLSDAVSTLSRQEIRNPLASLIFIKHHMGGAHEVEVDRLVTDEEGVGYAVLVYGEGELPIRADKLPRGVRAGSLVRYVPGKGGYVIGGSTEGGRGD